MSIRRYPRTPATSAALHRFGSTASRVKKLQTMAWTARQINLQTQLAVEALHPNSGIFLRHLIVHLTCIVGTACNEVSYSSRCFVCAANAFSSRRQPASEVIYDLTEAVVDKVVIPTCKLERHVVGSPHKPFANAHKTHTNQDTEAQALARAKSREASRKVIGADLKLSALPACLPGSTTHSPPQARGDSHGSYPNKNDLRDAAIVSRAAVQDQLATRDFPSIPSHELRNQSRRKTQLNMQG